MKLATWKAASVMAVVGVLLAAGMGTMMFSASAGQTSITGTTAATLADELLSNLTVRVGAIVEGRGVAVSGATVEVWSVNLTQNDTYMAIVLQKVAEATTDENGNVTFGLSAGNYLLVANYSGLSSVGQISLESEQTAILMLHSLDPPNHGPGSKERCPQNITA
jgi:hypothetical protein